MIINHNLMAMNTHRQLGINNMAGSKSMEKLSSGFRINRAGDDAAGLAISEKMRGQIRGLKQASRNAQDGISLIQTAEGALNETHAILQRMRELAVQSATDTNKPDRDEIQKEINQLTEEITRISTDIEFNTQNLLGGQFEAKFHIGANEGQNVKLTINDMSAAALGVEGNVGLVQEKTAVLGNAAGSALEGAAVGDKYTVEKMGEAQTVGGVADVQYLMRDKDDNIVGVSTNGASWSLVQSNQTLTNNAKDVTLGTAVVVNAGTNFTSIKSGTIEVTANSGADDYTLTVKADATLVDKPGLASGDYKVVGNTVPLPTGATQALVNAKGDVVAYGTNLNVWTDTQGKSLFGGTAINMGAAGSEVTVGGAGIDVSSQASADKAITTIDKAIGAVSGERSMLGAMQNRLEHTIANLGTSAENLQAAESRIRDLDMAEEIMAFTKNNILQQAATAMLAQANQQPQSVLQLLR
jgi:flagellin